MKETACILWAGSVDGKGYGLVHVNGKLAKAHRLAYRLYKGPWIKGQQICHTCDNPPCINPLHLFQGTASENQRDSVAKGRHAQTRKVLCVNGHPFSEENLYRRKDGTRECKECRRNNVRKHRSKK